MKVNMNSVKNCSIDDGKVNNINYKNQNQTQNQKNMISEFLDKAEDITRSNVPVDVNCNKLYSKGSTSTDSEHLNHQQHQHENNPYNPIGVDEALVRQIIAENDRLRQEVDEFLESCSFLVFEDDDENDDLIYESVCTHTQR